MWSGLRPGFNTDLRELGYQLRRFALPGRLARRQLRSGLRQLRRQLRRLAPGPLQLSRQPGGPRVRLRHHLEGDAAIAVVRSSGWTVAVVQLDQRRAGAARREPRGAAALLPQKNK
eukprot:1176645-Prorocentrum_minimum.AAC.1